MEIDTARLFIMHGANPEKELEWSDAGVDFRIPPPNKNLESNH